MEFQLETKRLFGSIRVLEKSGFQHEGTLRRFAYIGDTYHNVRYYGVIREDFDEK